MIPYNEKLWGVHPREITAAWCSRFVPLPNLDEVVAGAVGAGPPELGYNASFLYPKAGGIETLTRALLTRTCSGGPACSPGPAPTPSTGAARGRRRRRADRVPRAGRDHPAARAAQAHGRLPPEIETPAARLRCTTLRYLTSARAASRPPTSTGSTSPRRGIRSIAWTCSRRRCPMAPRGVRVVYVELADRGPISTRPCATRRGAGGGGRDPRRRTTSCSPSRKQIDYAYVVFDHHYYEATRAIFAFLEANAIFPRGRYGAGPTTRWRTAARRTRGRGAHRRDADAWSAA